METNKTVLDFQKHLLNPGCKIGILSPLIPYGYKFKKIKHHELRKRKERRSLLL